MRSERTMSVSFFSGCKAFVAPFFVAPMCMVCHHTLYNVHVVFCACACACMCTHNILMKPHFSIKSNVIISISDGFC